MSDQIAILMVVGLGLIFFGLWTFNNKQKRKFDDEQRKRRLERERKQIKTHSSTSQPSTSQAE